MKLTELIQVSTNIVRNAKYSHNRIYSMCHFPQRFFMQVYPEKSRTEKRRLINPIRSRLKTQIPSQLCCGSGSKQVINPTNERTPENRITAAKNPTCETIQQKTKMKNVAHLNIGFREQAMNTVYVSAFPPTIAHILKLKCVTY